MIKNRKKSPHKKKKKFSSKEAERKYIEEISIRYKIYIPKSKKEFKKYFVPTEKMPTLEKAWKYQKKRIANIKSGKYERDRQKKFKENFIKMLSYHNADEKIIRKIKYMRYKDILYFSKFVSNDIKLYGSTELTATEKSVDITNELNDQLGKLLNLE